LALKKNKFQFVITDPPSNEKFESEGIMEKKSQTSYVLHPSKMMRSTNVGSDNEKNIDFVIDDSINTDFGLSAVVGNGFYGVPKFDSFYLVDFTNGQLNEAKLQYRIPSCKTLSETKATYDNGVLQDITVWYK